VKKHEVDGEIFQLDDSKGCYIEVTHKDLVGYVGVNLRGTAESPFCWQTSDTQLTPDGLKIGNVNGPGEEVNLQALCRSLVQTHRQNEARKAFNPKDACEALHEFMEKLPD
jgi:hypothetical protein